MCLVWKLKRDRPHVAQSIMSACGGVVQHALAKNASSSAESSRASERRGTESLVQIPRVGGGRCTVARKLVRPAQAVKQVRSLSQLPADT